MNLISSGLKLTLGIAIVALVSCRGNEGANSESVVLAEAGERNIKSITCVDSSGDRRLSVQRSLNELPFPTFHVTLSFKGKEVVKVSDAPVKRNTKSGFMVQKVTNIGTRLGIQVSAGVNFSSGSAKGFYMEAANGGLSPLPGTDFSSCEVIESGTTSSATERNIKKMICVDGSGDRRLTIERSLNELPFPTYHLTFSFKGNVVVNVSDAPVARNTDKQFMVQKVVDLENRKDIEVSAGAHWSGNIAKGFYMEAANGGLSPLPGMEFPTCEVQEVVFQ